MNLFLVLSLLLAFSKLAYSSDFKSDTPSNNFDLVNENESSDNEGIKATWKDVLDVKDEKSDGCDDDSHDNISLYQSKIGGFLYSFYQWATSAIADHSYSSEKTDESKSINYKVVEDQDLISAQTDDSNLIKDLSKNDSLNASDSDKLKDREIYKSANVEEEKEEEKQEEVEEEKQEKEEEEKEEEEENNDNIIDSSSLTSKSNPGIVGGTGFSAYNNSNDDIISEEDCPVDDDEENDFNNDSEEVEKVNILPNENNNLPSEYGTVEASTGSGVSASQDTQSGPVATSEKAKSETMNPEKVNTEQAKLEKVNPEPTKLEKTNVMTANQEQMKVSKPLESKSDINSMANPSTLVELESSKASWSPLGISFTIMIGLLAAVGIGFGYNRLKKRHVVNSIEI